MTGTLFFSNDPHNIFVSNVFIDTYTLFNGFYGGLSCNYPEAYIDASAYYDNITVITSRDRTNSKSPQVLLPRLPGNTTFRNINVYDTYGSLIDANPQIQAGLWPAWDPMSESPRYVIWDNITSSLRNPDFLPDRYNVFTFFGSPSSVRKSYIQFSNMFYLDFKSFFFWAIYIGCSVLDDMTYTNGVFSNYYVGGSYLWAGQDWKSVFMKNLIFENSIGNAYQGVSMIDVQDIIFNNITLRNITGTQVPITSFITTNRSPSTSLIIDGLIIDDWSFLMSNFYSTFASLDYFELMNVHFSRVSIAGGESLVVLDDIKHLLFINMTFENIINSDTVNEGSAIILLNSLNLNSNVTTELYKVSLPFVDNSGHHSETNLFAISEDQLTD